MIFCTLINRHYYYQSDYVMKRAQGSLFDMDLIFSQISKIMGGQIIIRKMTRKPPTKWWKTQKSHTNTSLLGPMRALYNFLGLKWHQFTRSLRSLGTTKNHFYPTECTNAHMLSFCTLVCKKGPVHVFKICPFFLPSEWWLSLWFFLKENRDFLTWDLSIEPYKYNIMISNDTTLHKRL